MSASLVTASLVVDRLIGMLGMLLALPFGLSFLPMFHDPVSTSSISMMATTGVFTRISLWLKKTIEGTMASLRQWLKQSATLIHQACSNLIVKVFVNGMGEDFSFLTIAGICSLTYFLFIRAILVVFPPTWRANTSMKRYISPLRLMLSST